MAKKDRIQELLSADGIVIPNHVGIIMDGNGRWAQQRGMPRVYGHKKGVDAVRTSVSFARKVGVKSLTLFAFSSENWKRPEDEVSGLMELFSLLLKREVKNLHKHNVRLKIVGDLSGFSEGLRKKIHDAHELTENNDGLTLNIAANYGGRWDIVNACQQLASKVKAGELHVEHIDEEVFDQFTAFAAQPQLDLLIRTGGEMRVSNFMLWQLAYAELIFSALYWPDFDEQAFADAIEAFSTKERRFGLTGEQVRI